MSTTCARHGHPRRLVAAALAVLLVAGCAGEPSGPTATPGARLLELAAPTPASSSREQLDADFAARLADALAAGSWVLDPEAWSAVETLTPLESSIWLTGVRVAGARTARRWHARPPVPLDLPLGRTWVRVGDTTLNQRTAQLPDRPRPQRYWRDTSIPIVLRWRPDLGVLEAISEERPPTLAYGVRWGTGPRVTWWDARVAPEPDAARDVVPVERATVGRHTLDVLPVPTPGELRFGPLRLDADRLELAFGLADLRASSAGDAAGGDPDGALPRVRFALDVSVDGRRERAWDAVAGASAAPRRARADLARWRGERVTLHLVTAAEPDVPADACFAYWGGLTFRDPAAPSPTRPHVVLIDVDTLRADGLGCYGNPRDTSPRLDAWAAREAVRFDDHVSASNWTLPSTVSMLTGLPVTSHGVLRFPLAMDPRHEPLALRLRDAGYETWGSSDGAFVSPAHGFDTGFDRFEVRKLAHEVFAKNGWDLELRWLRHRNTSRPVFLFLQTYKVHTPFLNDARYDDPHAPYDGPLARGPVINRDVHALLEASGGAFPERDRRYLRAIYDAGVRRVDDVLGRFLESLPEVFGDEPYVVVVTSDHGEELGERGTIGHATTLHREQLAVPLLIRAPGVRGGEVVDAPASGLDLVPTLLELVGLPPDPRLLGRALLADPLSPDEPRVAQLDETGFAIQVRDWKLIEERGERSHPLGAGLYALDDDPWERAPLDELRRDRAAQLAAMLADFREEHGGRVVPHASDAALDDEQLAQLAELGYLDGD